MNGAALTGLCGGSEAGTYNKLGNRVFVGFEVLNQGDHDFVVTQIPDENQQTNADIDFYIFRQGVSVAFGESYAPGEERVTDELAEIGDYMMDIYLYEDGEHPQTCFDLQISR